MQDFRENVPDEMGSAKVNFVRDYKKGIITNRLTKDTMSSNLPKSDVVYYDCEDGTWVCARPSGTEPKIKFYFGVKAGTYEDMLERTEKLKKDIELKISNIK